MSATPRKGPPRTILVTGASGYIGRYFLERASLEYRLLALARRSRMDVGIPEHPQIRWFAVDLCDEEQVSHEIERIRREESVDFVVHLAGFYDFRNEPSPEYERANVVTTRHMLKHAERLGIRRFVLASSLVVSDFPRASSSINETTPGDATFPYARSKQAAETLVREYSERFPCSIVRLGATFSDWCEYPPLYMLMNQWLGGGLTSGFLAGRGSAAIPYVHVECVVRTFLRILERSDLLADLDVYIASRARSITQRELFRQVTRLHDGMEREPHFVPPSLAAVGLLLRRAVGRLKGQDPMERLWMMRYVDRRLDVDPSYTRRALHLEYRPRLQLERRLAYLIENYRCYPHEWHLRNERRLVRDREHLNLVLSDLMRVHRYEIVTRVHDRLRAEGDPLFVDYRLMEPDTLRPHVEAVYDLLTSAVRSGERGPLTAHVRLAASRRKRAGLPAEEVQGALRETGETVIEALTEIRRDERARLFLGNRIRLALEMAIDEVEHVYDGLAIENNFHDNFASGPWSDAAAGSS